ncbi:MAG: FtsX-like permease family protein [Actinomycetota bacterium]
MQEPAEIVNYRTMRAAPAVLASGLALGAIVALGLTLVASVRRRRRELALLKTLGFVPFQLASVVSWQASVPALIGAVVGVPAGVAVGRSLWSVFARAISAVPEPTVPVVPLVLVAVGALVLASLVALVPGHIATKAPTAALLRAE